MKRDNPQKTAAFFEGSSWYHRIKVLQEDGTVKYSKKGGFATEREANKSHAKYEEDFKKAYRAYHLAHKVNADILFKDYLIYWFEDVFSERIESTTRMVGAYVLYSLLIPCMDYDIKLRYVNTEYLDTLLEQVAKATKSAGNKAREFLNMAMKEAVIAGYIKVNPVAATKPYKRPKPKIIILNKIKIRMLLKAAMKTNWYVEILLALFCGLRKGELLGLKFSDFDFEKSTVYINRQLVSNPKIEKGSGSDISEYGVVERPPKTDNSYRTLRVPEVVMKEVLNRRQQIDLNKEKFGSAYEDHDYISCQKDGKPHSVTAMNGALTKLCSRNAIPQISVHGLRHMYATILIERGVPLIKISALLGHSSVHTTFEYYCEVMDENQNIIDFMNRTFVPDIA